MLTWTGPRSAIAISNAREVSSAMRSGEFTCTCHFVILEKMGICSVSWKPPRPMVMLPDSGVIAMTGEREKIVRIHIGRAHDSEGVFDTLRDQRFDKRFAGRHLELARRDRSF